jgi:hypothetical protein
MHERGHMHVFTRTPKALARAHSLARVRMRAVCRRVRTHSHPTTPRGTRGCSMGFAAGWMWQEVRKRLVCEHPGRIAAWAPRAEASPNPVGTLVRRLAPSLHHGSTMAHTSWCAPLPVLPTAGHCSAHWLAARW